MTLNAVSTAIVTIVLMALILMAGSDLIHEDWETWPEFGFAASVGIVSIWRVVVR